MELKYPEPLQKDGTIAITAFSGGVVADMHDRLNLVIHSLCETGYNVIEGRCLRNDFQSVSAPLTERVNELMAFLLDDNIDAILPPWGGEYAIELLPHLDFKTLENARPKWLVGFSDVSTLAVALTSKLGWVSVHAANLMQLHNGEVEPLTVETLNHLSTPQHQKFTQQSSSLYQKTIIPYEDDLAGNLNLTEKTLWKALSNENSLMMSGRVIGGCLDTLHHIINTHYFDIEKLKDSWQAEGTILYFENCELSVAEVKRVLWSFRIKGIFQNISGVLFGRNAGSQSYEGLSYQDVLKEAFDQLNIPVLYDVDIGHLPPNLCLMNGVRTKIRFELGTAEVTQYL
jgi:muramoyltetrapeptide carboxypeptidase LdcA involved in peptidoglycan recycling